MRWEPKWGHRRAAVPVEIGQLRAEIVTLNQRLANQKEAAANADELADRLRAANRSLADQVVQLVSDNELATSRLQLAVGAGTHYESAALQWSLADLFAARPAPVGGDIDLRNENARMRTALLRYEDLLARCRTSHGTRERYEVPCG